ncbi:MAG TPA: hypothetical protein VFF65_05295 [Phycisphaerales bacterium]|nr:hypothetical protein [Phycisphaerales bacterium]
MRKSRFCAPLLGLLVAATPFSGGLTQPAIAKDDLAAGYSAASQPLPPADDWDTYIQELIRRLREKMGDPDANTPVPVKSGAVALRLWFDAHGLPPDLTARDLEEMSAAATDLANCAELDPPPPLGTSFSLVVMLHDLGKQIGGALNDY